MQILLNGNEMMVSEGLTTQHLIEKLGLKGQRFAVEINQELVPRSDLSSHIVQAGDHVEIIQAIGGG